MTTKKKAALATRKRLASETDSRLAAMEERLAKMERVGERRAPHSEHGGIFSGTVLGEFGNMTQLELADWAGNVFRALSSLDQRERTQALEAMDDEQTMEWLQRSQVGPHHVAEAATLGHLSRLGIIDWLRDEQQQHMRDEQLRAAATEALKAGLFVPGKLPLTDEQIEQLARIDPKSYDTWYRRTWSRHEPERVHLVIQAARALCAERASMSD
jgi:hypothetical protein